ncbi:MAG TPA: archaeosine biosynthesis radical SAM protein RaSEA [Methanocorpusculum sp.]|nr:archaeosine biosynthesis radical SAM protein RaSEA [Methanocorpusculum sp.]
MYPIIKPLSSWKGQDRYFGTVLKSITTILLSGGCSWNKCRMCGYKHDRNSCASRDDLVSHMSSQIDWISQNYPSSEYDIGKIFTSGSVFDPFEVPCEILDKLGALFQGKKLIVESRAEYITEKPIEQLLSILDQGQSHPLTVSIGLETTNDDIREKSIQKGFSFDDFIHAADICHRYGVGVKAYLMLKPLFLTEKEAMDDMQKSIREVSKYADMISMNLCTVQSHTELEQYWHRGEFRPPYLWSALKILLDAEVEVSCDPVGGGFKRGPHNCGNCDSKIVSAIKEYSLYADKQVLLSVWNEGCSCKDEWLYVINNEYPWNMPLTE